MLVVSWCFGLFLGLLIKVQRFRLLALATILAMIFFLRKYTVQTICKELLLLLTEKDTFFEIDGITWINDSKATNVGATLSAVKGLSLGNSDKKFVLLLGGISKVADLSPLLDLVVNVRAVVCFGESAKVINSLFAKFVPVKEVTSMEDACREAKEFAEVGDTVLLSPACASFDMFANFMHRGETFSNAVKLVSKDYASI